MSGSHLSKDFFDLVKAIGESKSKQQEDNIIVRRAASAAVLCVSLARDGRVGRARPLPSRGAAIVFPGYGDGDAAWNPGAPWEGLVSSFELHASNRPAAVDWSKRESRRSLTELHSWIFQLAWR